MSRLVLPENALNGGLPEPPADEAVRVVDAHHDACGASTRVRLPGTLPARAVRRFHCAGCASAFEAQRVEEIELRLNGTAYAPAPEPEPAPEPAPAPAPANLEAQPEAMEARAVEALTRAPKPRRAKPAKPKLAKPKVAKPKLSKPKLSAPKIALPKVSLPKLSRPKASPPKASQPKVSRPTLALPKVSIPRIEPDSRTWRLLSIPIAAILVVAGLLLLRDSDSQPAPVAPPPPAEQAASPTEPAAPADSNDEPAAAQGQGSKKTKFVHESSFSLALPEGWERVDPPAGATFAAVAADGGADATLWITQDPKLEFPTFVKQSLAQLETLAGSARIVERVPGPTPESSVVTLAADAPAGQPTYEATLRVAGPYRYYLATSVQPDAATETADGVELITGSLTPELEG